MAVMEASGADYFEFEAFSGSVVTSVDDDDDTDATTPVFASSAATALESGLRTGLTRSFLFSSSSCSSVPPVDPFVVPVEPAPSICCAIWLRLTRRVPAGVEGKMRWSEEEEESRGREEPGT